MPPERPRWTLPDDWPHHGSRCVRNLSCTATSRGIRRKWRPHEVPLVRRHIQKGLALPLVYRRLIRTRLSRWSALVENQGFRRDRLGFPATVAVPVVEERRTSREPGSQAISVQEIAGRSMHAALSKEPRTPVSRACRRSRASRRWQGA